ncbi:MAG: CapA family protein [Proteobacteria bacterium]|nr:CapA family protein [Pseudomonadota bacterium]
MIYESESGDLAIALGGDVMLTRRLSVYGEDEFTRLRDIIRGADCAFANLEATVRDWDEGTPGITQGTYMTTRPALLEDLKWLGLGIVSCANNHAFDYGEGGVLATIRHLDEAGIAHAGTGANLALARAPGYLDTPKGRVALIAATATFRPWNKAGEQRPDMGGRPGVNSLASETTYGADAQSFAELRRLGAGLGFDRARQRNRGHFYSDKEVPPEEDEDELRFLGQRFVKGNGFTISTRPDEADMAENLKWIAEARRQADWVVASLHYHEFGAKSLMAAKTRTEIEEPAEFIITFARAAIDAGADIFVGHGPHIPFGVEIYKGRPILYSLGNFIFENETVEHFPSDAYQRFDLGPEATPADFLDARSAGGKKGHAAHSGFWENIVARCRFEGRKLIEITLHPIDQGFGRPRPQRGRPMLARGEVAARVLERIKRISAGYGTEVELIDGTGVIRP